MNMKIYLKKVVYFIHHTPFAKDYISNNDLKMLSDLVLFLHTGKYEIIEFETYIIELQELKKYMIT